MHMMLPHNMLARQNQKDEPEYFLLAPLRHRLHHLDYACRVTRDDFESQHSTAEGR
jgi:hypothetical protein